ncbi:MAG: hypothetical protein ACKPE3_28685 [Sphaerospermopsis kisseleviana]
MEKTPFTETTLTVDCDLSDHCELDNCYDDLKNAVLWVHEQRAAVGCELSAADNNFKVTKM